MLRRNDQRSRNCVPAGLFQGLRERTSRPRGMCPGGTRGEPPCGWRHIQPLFRLCQWTLCPTGDNLMESIGVAAPDDPGRADAMVVDLHTPGRPDSTMTDPQILRRGE